MSDLDDWKGELDMWLYDCTEDEGAARMQKHSTRFETSRERRYRNLIGFMLSRMEDTGFADACPASMQYIRRELAALDATCPVKEAV